MTLLARLDRAQSALTARQRFLIALNDYHQGRTTAPEVTRMPESERAEYDSYARLVFAVNERLGGYCWMLKQHAGWLGEELRTVLVLEDAAVQLEEKESLPFEQPTRAWRKQPEVTVPFFLRGMALELRQSLIDRLDAVWKDLLAIEAVWAEAASELGDDPVHPEVRERSANAKVEVQDLRLKAGAKKRALMPGEQDIEQMRRQVREAAGLESPSRAAAGTPLEPL